MNAFLSKLAVLGVVAGGFYATGDLPRLIERGRKITERTSAPLPNGPQPTAGPPAVAPAPSPPPPSVRELPQAAPQPVAPPPVTAASRPAPSAVSEQPIAVAEHRDEGEPSRIPIPRFPLDAVDLATLSPGQRVLLLCGRHVVALDVVDGPAGEVLEHAHACHADRTVTIASTAAPRRLVVIGCSAGSDRGYPRAGRRITRGERLHLAPSGQIQTGGMPASAGEAIGPIEGIALE